MLLLKEGAGEAVKDTRILYKHFKPYYKMTHTYKFVFLHIYSL